MKKYISFLFLLLCVSVLNGQSRKELENERNRIIKEIELAQQSLEKTNLSKTEKIKDLQILEEKITKRESLISNIKNSVKKADLDVQENNALLAKLNRDIIEIKEQYHKLLRYSYLKKLGTNKWTYLLSSENLNNAFLRWRYMKQFEQFCKEKALEIKDLQGEIDSKNELILVTKSEQEKLLQTESSQFALLQQEKQTKNKIVRELSKDEAKWKKEIIKATKEREKLNLEIEKVIVSELKKREINTPEESKETVALSGAFADNKGKLPWPVEEGFISGEFGVQQHPSIKGLKINNNGIDIRSKPGASVKAINKGKVIGVTQIPGYDNMIIVQHGDFYTVYSKLASVSVKKDEIISVGENIGKLSDTDSVLHFEVWKNKSKVNPAHWLIKK